MGNTGSNLPILKRAVFFLDMTGRDKEPGFYWLVFVTWIVFGVFMVSLATKIA